MAGLEADVSSYNQQPLPVSPLDMAKNLGALQQQKQQIQSGAITIDKQKLDLINTQFNLINQELSALSDDPNITKAQAAERLTRFANTYKLPKEATDHMLLELNQAPNVKTFSDVALRRGMTVQEKLNQQYGATETQSDQATSYQGVRAPPSKGGGFIPSTQMPIQLPPSTANVNNQRLLPDGTPNPAYLQPGLLGPAGPAGVTPVPRPSPVRMPVEAPPARVSGASGPTVQTGFNFDQRFAGDGGRVVTGAPPGVASAIQAVGEKSGLDLATALQKAGNIQADIQPDLTVLDIVKGKAPGDFGPGTDAFNQLKKVAVTWLPNVDAKLIEDSKDFDTVKKYLIQGARSAGNTGTNDQLAAAFEGSPNVTMNTATIESIVKTRVALKKMEAAQALLANQQNIQPSEFSRWKAKNQNVLDPRAFGWDMMDNEARSKLVKRLTPKEYQRLEQSVQFAHDAQLIEPPARK